MHATPPAAQRFAEHLIGRPFVEYATEKRQATPKWSWRMIARQLATDTGGQVDVAPETLRMWFIDDEAAA